MKDIKKQITKTEEISFLDVFGVGVVVNHELPMSRHTSVLLRRVKDNEASILMIVDARAEADIHVAAFKTEGLNQYNKKYCKDGEICTHVLGGIYIYYWTGKSKIKRIPHLRKTILDYYKGMKRDVIEHSSRKFRRRKNKIK